MIIDGTIVVKIRFYGLDVEDDDESTILEEVFQDGWEGELDVLSVEADSCE